MKHNKDLRFCMATLQAMLDRDEFEPGQRRLLLVAQKMMKGLGRKTNPAKAEIYRVVRQVAEAILNTLKND
jgi:hypothetical protein